MSPRKNVEVKIRRSYIDGLTSSVPQARYFTMTRCNSRLAGNAKIAKRRRLICQLEHLEQRNLLAGHVDDSWMWFDSFDDVPRVELSELSATEDPGPDAMGPHAQVASEWNVQLHDDVLESLSDLGAINHLLDGDRVDFEVIAGLGSPGLVLLRGVAPTHAEIAGALGTHDLVDRFSANRLIEGQANPNDEEFQAGLLTGLTEVNAPDAWDQSVGSLSTVVGVVDGGIDATHPDLYLNIWLNQGEIPATLADQLVDIDDDGLITFYDLNNVTVDDATGELVAPDFSLGPNADFVSDRNANGRIDAIDLLDDVRWADGRDTDGNRFFDDLFGVNFRSGNDDPFPNNRPLDELGHGTHVAGTIGAIGNNGVGVVGVNWQTSLMSLRILDNNNQADASAAIRAINYARQMRADMTRSDDGSVMGGANVRVLNNSWGQPGGFDAALENVIQASGEEGILFVAAAGNGNILGTGVDNDQAPFFPAGYDSDNVIAVSALAADGSKLASFSNFGASSVDIAAPGVGILSTSRGDFLSANGTSSATPHVSGTAALIWSLFPEATVDEVRTAILGSVAPFAVGASVVSSGGKLDTAAAIEAEVFSPAARLIAKEDITTAGGTSTEFTVEYSHRSGIDVSTIGDDDLLIVRQWGPASELNASLKPDSVNTDGMSTTATYVVQAPGGSWDPLDFGDYSISTLAGSVDSIGGTKSIEVREIGAFNVRIESPGFLYVDNLTDVPGTQSLRDAILAANAASTPITIILDEGRHTIDMPHVADPGSPFPDPDPSCAVLGVTGWSGPTTGDFDILGELTIIGNQSDLTSIDANALDRVFKVHPNASLTLNRVTVTGGVSPVDQGGGGILSAGTLLLQDAVVRDNHALAALGAEPIRGGGIAAWGGTTDLERSWIDLNEADFGGGVFYCENATGAILQSTISDNSGGGLHSHSDANITVNNSTFSGNDGGAGAIFNGKRDGMDVANNASELPKVSEDGSVVVFQSSANNLVPGDTNNLPDVFAFDRVTGVLERINAANPTGLDGGATNPSVSSDGRFVAFTSISNNLVPGDTNNLSDVFVYDRVLQTTDRVSLASGGLQLNGNSGVADISADGRFVAFLTDANNLGFADGNNVADLFVHDRLTGITDLVATNSSGGVPDAAIISYSMSFTGQFFTFVTAASDVVPGDVNGFADVFVVDRATGVTERVNEIPSGSTDGSVGVASISADGRFVTFDSIATNLVENDTNDQPDVFLADRLLSSVTRISVDNLGQEGNNTSFNPTISADGRFITFESGADNLSDDDNNEDFDIFVYDRFTQQVDRLITNEGEPNDASRNASLNFDGSVVVFESLASNFVPNDRNAISDVFVFDAFDGSFTLPTNREQILSTIEVSQATLALTTDSTTVVAGPVTLDNVLLSRNEPAAEISSSVVQLENVVSGVSLGADLIGPLTQVGDLPPVHPLQNGNPAIDFGSARLAGTIDQVGTVREVPDVGAFEAVTGTVAGILFVDLNENKLFDANEPGIADVEIRILDRDGEKIEVTRADDPTTIDFDETGFYEFGVIEPGIVQLEITTPPGFTVSDDLLDRALPPGINANGFSTNPAFSAEGSFVAFETSASNLEAGDFNQASDIYVFDEIFDTVTRLSFSSFPFTDTNAGSFNPTLSGDGRFVAYQSSANNIVGDDVNAFDDVYYLDRAFNVPMLISRNDDGTVGNNHSGFPSLTGDGLKVTYASDASNLVSDDTNGVTDIFVVTPATQETIRVSVSDSGEEANGVSTKPAFSFDGRFVAFDSFASNLVADDTNGVRDIFVRDLVANTTERVSVGANGEQANAASDIASISADGRFVTFQSNASNLVPGDTNGVADVFVYDRLEQTTERVSKASDGTQANDASLSFDESISADGRFVLFSSTATNLVEGDENLLPDIFVYDRFNDELEIVSVSRDGQQANNASGFAAISLDGRRVGFTSFATNLSSVDTNGFPDVFTLTNPSSEFDSGGIVTPGFIANDLQLGLIPEPGQILGALYEDVIPNGIFDSGETPIVDQVVFLDTNQNRVLDDGEVSTRSLEDGTYRFDDVGSFREQTIVVQTPIGFEPANGESQQASSTTIFLPAGGSVSGRDFGFRRVTGTGQSSFSLVSGRIYQDNNDNGEFDAGDVPLPDTVVFLDQQNFGIRDPDEPAVATDANGNYVIDKLGPSVVAISTILDETFVQTSPLGSAFELSTVPLFDELQPFGNAQSIATADFNGDSLTDVAVALAEANLVSIRLNDGAGGFLPDALNFELGSDGGGPTSLVVGQFDGADTAPDIAVVNNFASNLMILSGFDGSTFTSRLTLDVGEEPLDVTTAAIGGDENHLDIVLVNRADNTLQVAMNDGAGGFSVQAPIDSGGTSPIALVSGQFDGDGEVDVAVTHAVSSIGSPVGDVRILLGDGTGSFQLTGQINEVGATPTDLISGDYDGNGVVDLAVSNFASNTISILTGNGDGSFSVQPQTLGTASGALDIASADIDADGNVDIVASNLLNRDVSIFRNRTAQPGVTSFEPLEAVALGQFGLAQRMPLALADFDQDGSGPNGENTIDIISVPAQTDTLHLLSNRLVNGAHRVELTGLNQRTGLDFVVTPAALPPTLDAIADPPAIIEDSQAQSLTLTGITKGREGGPPLRIVATSSDVSVLPDPTIDFADGDTTATLVYTPAADASGVVTIAVAVQDAGADQAFDTDDDTQAVRTFEVIVLPVVDQAIVLSGSGTTLFLSQPDSALDGIQLIDIRGSGDNTLMLDAARIRTVFANGEVIVLSDSGDVINFDDGWEFERAFLGDDQLVRQFTQSGATLNLIGPDDFTNPMMGFDVNASGDVSSLDALQVINELGRRIFSTPAGELRDITQVDLQNFRFYDVSRDGMITALDALRVINQLARPSSEAEGELWVASLVERQGGGSHDSDAEFDTRTPLPDDAVDDVIGRQSDTADDRSDTSSKHLPLAGDDLAERGDSTSSRIEAVDQFLSEFAEA